MILLPPLIRSLLALLAGMTFAVGIALIIDTGIWQQPVGMILVSLVVFFVVRVLLELPDEFRKVLYGLHEDDDPLDLR